MSYGKPICNKNCGVLLLMMHKLQENISPTLKYNLLDSIRELKVQGKPMN